MAENISREVDGDTQTKRAAWRAFASSQGMVCLVCRDVPMLEHRAQFYDTGLCATCADELSAEP
jgi:hypothetical protein